MKLLIGIIFISIFSNFNAQKIDSLDFDGDGILNPDDWCPNVKGVKEFNGCPDPKLDCTNFQIEKKAIFDKFKNEAINVDYSKLPDVILNNFNFKKLKKANLILSPINVKGYDCGVPFMYECSSDYNVINPNFSADNFLTSKIIGHLKSKLKANIIPAMSINNFENEWGLNLYKTTYKTYYTKFNLNMFNDYILKNSTIGEVYDNNKESKIYYFQYKNQKLNITNANYLMIDFKNELNNIVIVDIYYNKEEIPETLKFQYEKHKWQKL